MVRFNGVILLLFALWVFFWLSILNANAANISGIVTSANNGPAVNRALVVLTSNNTIAAQDETGTNGHYSLNVNPGSYIVVTSAGGHNSKSTPINVDTSATKNIALTPLAKIDFRKRGRFVGFVKDENKRNISNVLIFLKQGNQVIGVTKPAKNTGLYELQWYVPGSYTVMAVTGNASVSHENQTIVAGESTWLDLVL